MVVSNQTRYGRWNAFREVPPRVRWLVYLSCFSNLGYGYVVIVIAAYLPELGMSATDAGLLMAVTGVTFVLSAVPLGIVADRRGRKPMFLAGLTGVPPTILAFGLTTDLNVLIIASAVSGVTEGAFMASWNAMIADQTSPGRSRDQAFALSFIVFNATFGIGFALPLAFPWIESHTGWSSHEVHVGAFLVLAALSVLSPIIAWFVLRDYREEMHPSGKLIAKRSRTMLWKFSGINGLIGFGAGFIIPLIPTWLYLKFGVPDSLSGPLLAVSNITIGLASIGSAWTSKRFGIVNAIVLTSGSSTIFMLMLAYVPNAPLAAGIYLIRAALMNMSGPLLDSFMMGIISKEDRGLASAINSIIWRLPNSASTVMGGALLAAGHYDLPFLIATSLYVVSLALFYIVFKGVKPAG